MFLLPGIAITVIRTLFIISDMTNNTSAFSFAITFVAQHYPGLVSGSSPGCGSKLKSGVVGEVLGHLQSTAGAGAEQDNVLLAFCVNQSKQ